QIVGQHRQLEMIAIHVEAARRMRRQPGIVVRLLDQVFGTAPLVVKPDHEVDRIGQVGSQRPGICTGWSRTTGTARFPPRPLPRALSHSAGLRSDTPSSIPPADSGIHTPTRHPSSSTASTPPGGSCSTSRDVLRAEITNRALRSSYA